MPLSCPSPPPKQATPAIMPYTASAALSRQGHYGPERALRWGPSCDLIRNASMPPGGACIWCHTSQGHPSTHVYCPCHSALQLRGAGAEGQPSLLLLHRRALGARRGACVLPPLALPTRWCPWSLPLAPLPHTCTRPPAQTDELPVAAGVRARLPWLLLDVSGGAGDLACGRVHAHARLSVIAAPVQWHHEKQLLCAVASNRPPSGP